ncbi:hypothetical protein [Sphingomonas sp. Leaf4]|uniref:hypothetical protein n=1 Tax=Sphingomonas sp. Leaf4 TaxID=2876553 RepID=UPI001E30DA0E|nr:hypothetical protein [Sphingomonas sp. Leaf4]
MSVEIPWTRIRSLTVRPRIFGGEQAGAFGVDLRTPRPGDRWAADLATANLRRDTDTLLLISALTEALSIDGRIELRQPGIKRPLYGYAVEVDGAGQAGSVLKVRGVRRSAPVTPGQQFSIVHKGVHHVYQVAGTRQILAGADGKMTFPIWPMLRGLTVDGSRVALDDPMIEGKVLGFAEKGVTSVLNRTEPVSFTIEERR